MKLVHFLVKRFVTQPHITENEEISNAPAYHRHVFFKPNLFVRPSKLLRKQIYLILRASVVMPGRNTSSYLLQIKSFFEHFVFCTGKIRRLLLTLKETERLYVEIPDACKLLYPPFSCSKVKSQSKIWTHAHKMISDSSL